MAVCEIHAVHATTKKALKYITRSDKTKDGALVFSGGCSTDYALADRQMQLHRERFGKDDKVLLHHGYVSFEGHEVTPEKALEFAREFMEGKFAGFQYLGSVHVDTDNVHFNFMVNAVDENGKKYAGNQKTLSEVRAWVDECCLRHDLSVVIPKGKGVSYKEWMEKNQGTSVKEAIKKDIDAAIKNSGSFPEFLKCMRTDGYEVKQGSNIKHIVFKRKGMEKGFRGRSLGEAYTEEAIKQRIKNKEFGFVPSENFWKPSRKLNAMEKEVRKAYYRHTELSTVFALAIYLLYAKVTGQRFRIKKYSPGKQHLIYAAALSEIRKLEGQLKFIREYHLKSKGDLQSLILELKEEPSTKEVNGKLKLCREIEAVMEQDRRYELPESVMKELNRSEQKTTIKQR